MLYFDHNATSPLCPVARDAWIDAQQQYPGNPSSPHRLGTRADTAIAGARARCAAALGCDPHCLVWTSGATESNNTIVRHFSVTTSGEAWVSAIEHPSLLGPIRHYYARKHQFIPVLATGIIDLEWLDKSLPTDRPAFVAVMAANNETGVLQPWREVAALCRRVDVPFFCDAVQWIGKLDARELGGCDFLSGTAHKFGGPQGIGFLKCPGTIDPLLRGGPQEELRRAGTENVAASLAAAAALQHRVESVSGGEIHSRTETRDAFIRSLKATAPDVRILGEEAPRLWNTVTAVMPPLRGGARWVVKLDKLGFAVSTGSACASGREEPSHVARAMGLTADAAGRMLRFSSGWETSAGQWDELLDGIRRVGQEDCV